MAKRGLAITVALAAHANRLHGRQNERSASLLPALAVPPPSADRVRNRSTALQQILLHLPRVTALRITWQRL